MPTFKNYQEFINTIDSLKWPHLREKAKAKLKAHFESTFKEGVPTDQCFVFEAMAKHPDLLLKLAKFYVDKPDLYFLTQISCCYIYRSNFVGLRQFISLLLGLKMNESNWEDLNREREKRAYYNAMIDYIFKIPNFKAFDEIINLYSLSPFMQRELFSSAGYYAAGSENKAVIYWLKIKLKHGSSLSIRNALLRGATLAYSCTNDAIAIKQLLADRPDNVLPVIITVLEGDNTTALLEKIREEPFVSATQIQLAQHVNSVEILVRGNYRELLACMKENFLALLCLNFKHQMAFLILDEILAAFHQASHNDREDIKVFFKLIIDQLIENYDYIIDPIDKFDRLGWSMSRCSVLDLATISQLEQYCIDLFLTKRRNTLPLALREMVDTISICIRARFGREAFHRATALHAKIIFSILNKDKVSRVSTYVSDMDKSTCLISSLYPYFMAYMEEKDLLYLLSFYSLSHGPLESILAFIIFEKIKKMPANQWAKPPLPQQLIAFIEKKQAGGISATDFTEALSTHTKNMRLLLRKVTLTVLQVSAYLSLLCHDSFGAMVLLPQLVHQFNKLAGGIFPIDLAQDILNRVLPANVSFKDLATASHVYTCLAEQCKGRENELRRVEEGWMPRRPSL